MESKMAPTNRILATLFLMAILFIPIISALPRDAELSIDFTYPQPSGNITNEYINNTYINQTVNATVNTTQFDSNNPISIKMSWLQSMIEYFAPAPDLNGYFKLDQTTPQTITGGRPIFNAGLGTPTGNNFIWGDGTLTTATNNIIIGDGSVTMTSGGSNIIIGNGITKSGYTYGETIIGNGAPSVSSNSASYGSRTLSGPHQFNNGNVIIGHRSNTVDPELKFFANTNTGNIKWWEDENYFQFLNFFVADNIKAMFGTSRDASLYFDGTNMIFNTGTSLAHFSNNVSATGYITRTETFDKSKGSALDLIKDSSELKDSKGKINHSEFYGYTTYEVADYSKPVINNICSEQKGESNEIICEDIITYPNKKIEEGVNIVSEIELLRQSIYELKEQNKLLTARISKIETETCSIKLFSWCIK